MLSTIKNILKSDYTKLFLQIIGSIGLCCFFIGLTNGMVMLDVLLIQKETNLIATLLSSEAALLSAAGVVFFCMSRIGFLFTGNTVKLVDKTLVAKEDAMEEDRAHINELKNKHNADKKVPSLCFLAARSALKDKIEKKELLQITEPAQQIVKDARKIENGPNSKKWVKHLKIT